MPYENEPLYIRENDEHDVEISEFTPIQEVENLINQLETLTSLDDLDKFPPLKFETKEEYENFLKLWKGQIESVSAAYLNIVTKNVNAALDFLESNQADLTDEQLEYYDDIYYLLIDLRDVIAEMRLQTHEIFEATKHLGTQLPSDKKINLRTQRHSRRTIRLPKHFGKMAATLSGVFMLLSPNVINAANANNVEVQFKNETLPLCNIDPSTVTSIESLINEITQTRIQLQQYWNEYCSGHINAMEASSIQETGPQAESLNYNLISIEVRLPNGEAVDTNITLEQLHERYPELVDVNLIDEWLKRFITEGGMPEEVLDPNNLQLVVNLSSLPSGESQQLDAIGLALEDQQTYVLRLKTAVIVEEGGREVMHERGNYVFLIGTESAAYIPQGQLLDEIGANLQNVSIPEYGPSTNYDEIVSLELSGNLVKVWIKNPETGEFENNASLSIPDMTRNGGYGTGTIIIHEGFEAEDLVLDNEGTPIAISTPAPNSEPRMLRRSSGEVIRVEDEEVPSNSFTLSEDAASALDFVNEFNHDGEYTGGDIENGDDYEVAYSNDQVNVIDTKGFRENFNFENSHNPGYEDETLMLRAKATIVAGIYNQRFNTNITAEDVILNPNIMTELSGATFTVPLISNMETGQNQTGEKSIADFVNEPINIIRLGENFSGSPMEGVIGNNNNPQQFVLMSESGQIYFFVFSPSRDGQKGKPEIFNNPNGTEMFHMEDYYELNDAFTKLLRDQGVDANTAYEMMLNLFRGWVDFTKQGDFTKSPRQLEAEAALQN